MVITMTWQTKYMHRNDFISLFSQEQEYVDAMFIQMIMFNYGVFIDKDTLR